MRKFKVGDRVLADYYGNPIPGVVTGECEMGISVKIDVKSIEAVKAGYAHADEDLWDADSLRLTLAQAIRIVGDDERCAYPEMSNRDAVAYARDLLSLPGEGFDSRYDLDGDPGERTFDAFTMVLKATGEELAAVFARGLAQG